jgi:hypothetical protein
MLSREDILNRDDLYKEKLDVPEWHCTLYVRTMTGAERNWLRNVIIDDDANILPAYRLNSAIYPHLVAITACNDDGTSIFTLSDVPALQKKSAVAIERIAEAAMRINRMRPDDREELAKNSATMLNNASGSALPSASE